MTLQCPQLLPDEKEENYGDCEARRQAELEFVSSAYEPNEAWCDHGQTNVATIHRRLQLCHGHDDSSLVLHLTLTLPPEYPTRKPLEVDASLEDSGTSKNSSLQKSALNAIPSLLSKCRNTAQENIGEESVFLVLNVAEEWVHEQALSVGCEEGKNNSIEDVQPLSSTGVLTLGRRLIYSHHIISKKKRADIKALASEYSLTGYMKIGWPGLLIVEGEEEDCNNFYDSIRSWSWQYLVVRGEQQEKIAVGRTIDSLRRFQSFQEVEDMSTVAGECRKAGLEALFRTSMKVYDNDENGNMTLGERKDVATTWFGALILVDHMNDGKGYRKWLRKTSLEVGCFLLVKQFYPGEDYSKRPKIFVCVVGDKRDVSTFLKRWRSSRVDVDSRGKACLERQMTTLHEGVLTFENPYDALDWDQAASEDKFTVTEDQMTITLNQLGWTQTGKDILGFIEV